MLFGNTLNDEIEDGTFEVLFGQNTVGCVVVTDSTPVKEYWFLRFAGALVQASGSATVTFKHKGGIPEGVPGETEAELTAWYDEHVSSKLDAPFDLRLIFRHTAEQVSS